MEIIPATAATEGVVDMEALGLTAKVATALPVRSAAVVQAAAAAAAVVQASAP